MPGRSRTQQARFVSLQAAGGLDPGLVGPKARTLGRLQASGLPIPAGVVLTTHAWRGFAEPSGLLAALREASRTSREELGAAARRLEGLFDQAPLPAGLEQELAEALRDLPGPYAVRSSSPGEDGWLASAAGLFTSVLDVTGTAGVLEAVRQCWRSAFSEAALSYRLDQQVPLQPERAMAVIVQRMIPARAAGVLFSRADDGQTLVEAVAGPGGGLVDGRVDPVRYLLPRAGAPRAPGPGPLEAARLGELRELGLRVEALLGAPVDLEWVLDDERVHLVQARPITRAVSAAGPSRVRWTAANTQEALLDPVTPLTWSLFAPLVERGRRDLFRAAGFREVEGPGYMRIFYGLPYFNPDYFQRFLEQIPGAPRNVFDALIFGEGEQRIAFRLPEFDARTLRLIALYVLGRLLARERFELFSRWFSLRLRLLDRRELTALSDDALVVRRRQATRLLEAALRRHVLGTAISGAGYLLLDLFLEASGAGAAFPEGLVSRLTAGASGNALAVASTHLEELAREAARHPRLVEALRRASALRWEELARLGAEGRWFVRELGGFLSEHGHRAEKEAELAEPRWADDPAVVLSVLTSFTRAAQDEEGGLRHQRQREASLRQSAAALAGQVRDWLARRPLERLLPWRRLAFGALLREARRYAPYRENLKDRALRAIHLLRRVFLEGGRRLARRGTLSRTEDVFYLELSEVEEALLGTRPGTDYQALVDQRRADRERFLGQEPPRYVIEVPGQEPRPVYVKERIGRLLEGVGASGGQVTGVARVLRSTEDAHRLRPGEVIVARVINAGWTPLFHLAGGLVAEVGGVLSHAAIVAREYGIPAVFGAAGATRIPDGARVCVDGDLGIVTLEDQRPSDQTPSS